MKYSLRSLMIVADRQHRLGKGGQGGRRGGSRCAKREEGRSQGREEVTPRYFGMARCISIIQPGVSRT